MAARLIRIGDNLRDWHQLHPRRSRRIRRDWLLARGLAQ